MHQLGYVNCCNIWLPHKLSERNLLNCVSVCDSLLKCNESILFLKQIVMDNEKWILYSNVEWIKLWSKWNEPPPTTPKSGLHPKKVVVYIWWDWKGVLYYDLLLEIQKINSNKHCSQLDQLKASYNKKYLELLNRKFLIFHWENTRWHISLMTKAKTVTAWLGSSDSFAIFTRHCTIRFPFTLAFTKFSERKNISISWKTVKGALNSSLLKKR